MNEPKRERVDIEAVKQNALAQGIALREIAIQYVGLTDMEKLALAEMNLITHDSADSVIGRFTESGDALFPEKIVGVIYLAA